MAPKSESMENVTALKATIAQLKASLQRKDKRLAKAATKETEMETLLLQSESDIEHLRSQVAAAEKQQQVDNPALNGKQTDRMHQLQATLKEKRDALAVSETRCHTFEHEIQQKDQLIQHIRNQLADHETRLSQLSSADAAAAEKTALVEQLRAQITRLEADMHAIQIHSDHVTESLSEKDQALADLCHLLDTRENQAQPDFTKTQNVVSEIRSLLQTRQSEIDQCRVSLSTAEEKLADHQTQLEERSKQHEITSAELTETVSQLEAKKAELEETRRLKAQENELAHQDENQLRADLDRKDKQLAETQRLLTDAESAMKENEVTRKLAEQKDGEIEDLRQRLAEQKAAQADTGEETAKQMRQLQTSLDAKDADIVRLRAELDSAISGATERQEAADSIVAAKDNEISHLKDQLSGARNDLKASVDRVDQLEKQIKLAQVTAESREQELLGTIEAKKEVVEKLQADISGTAETTEKQNQVYESSIAEAEAKCSEMAKELKSTNDELRTLQNAQKQKLDELQSQSATQLSLKQDEISDLHHKLNEAQHEIVQLTTALSDAKETSSRDASQSKHTLEQKMEELSKAHSALAEVKQEYEMKLSSLATERSEDVESLRVLTEKLATATRQLTEARQNLSDNQERFHASKGDFEQKISQLQESVTLHEAEKVEMETSLRKKDAQFLEESSSLSSQLQKTQSEFEELHATLQDREAELKEARSSLHDTEEKLTAAMDKNEESSKKLNEALSLKEAEINEKSTCIKQLEKTMTDLSSSLKQFEVERDDMASALEGIQMASQNAVKEAQEDAAKIISDLTVTKEDLSEEIQSLQQDRAEFETSERLMTEQIKALETSLSSREESIALLENQKQDFHKKVTDLSQENKSLRDSLSESDKLVSAASENSEKAVQLLTEAQEKKMREANRKLRESQAEEEVSKSALHSVVSRLDNMLSGSTGESSDVLAFDTSSCVAVLRHANSVLLKLEESLANGHRWEEESQELMNSFDLMKTSNAGLKKENAKLKKSVTESESKVAEWRENLDKMAALAEEADIAVESYKEAAERAEERVHQQDEAAEVILRALRSHQEDLENENSNLREKCSSSAREKAKLSEEIDILRRARDQASESQEDLLAQMEQFMALKAEHESLLTEYESVQVERDGLTEKMKKYMEDLDSGMAQRKILESELESAETNLEKAKGALSVFEESARELQADSAEKTTKLEDLQKEISRLNTRIADLKSSAAEASNSSQTELDSLREEMEEQHRSHVEDLKKSFSLQFQAAAEKSQEVTSGIKDQMNALQEALSSLETERSRLQEELTSSKSTNAQVVKALETKLDAAIDAHKKALEQKNDLEKGLDAENDNKSALTAELEEMSEQAAEHERERSKLQEKLMSAELSIAALEVKNANMEKSTSEATKLRDEERDSFIQHAESLRKQLDDITKVHREAEAVAAQRLSHIERLERSIIPTLEKEAACAQEERDNVVEILDRRNEEFEKLNNTVVAENDTLSQKLNETTGRVERHEEELEARNRLIEDLREAVALSNDKLQALQEDMTDKEDQTKVLNDKLADLLSELATSRQQTEQASCDLSRKKEALHKATEAYNEVSQRCTMLEETKGSVDNVISTELAEATTIAMRNSARYGRKVAKLQKRLKLSEKQLMLEKKKNLALTDTRRQHVVSARENFMLSVREDLEKRAISPSTKGLSPALKRAREQLKEQGRAPLSPLARRSSRPPRMPRQSLARTPTNF